LTETSGFCSSTKYFGIVKRLPTYRNSKTNLHIPGWQNQ